MLTAQFFVRALSVLRLFQKKTVSLNIDADFAKIPLSLQTLKPIHAPGSLLKDNIVYPESHGCFFPMIVDCRNI